MAVARRSADIQVMIEAAEKAGRGLIRDFGEVENLQVSKKGPGNFVSTADLKSEKTIREMLEKARPGFGFLMEESGKSDGADKTARWIVDPLDGTSNFLHGVPHWCIAIALEKNGEVVAAVTHDPVKDELFWAEKGKGAFVNNRRLRVSARRQVQDSMLAINFDISDFVNTRQTGSSALDLAYVAAGRFDGYAQKRFGAWDVSGGCLLVREAGGVVTDFSGAKFNHTEVKGIAAGSSFIQPEIVKRLI